MEVITRHTASRQPRLARVAAYCRVSTENDHSFKSLSAQVSYYNQIIGATPGWVFAGVYADNGITGTSTRHRQQFNQLMRDARAGKIDIILTKSISRFARNTVDLLATVRELKTLGVEVRFERENIHSLSSDGELLLTLLASFAQEESRSISENVKWSIRKRYEQGITNSHRIYGYTWRGGQLVINDDEASIIRRIFADYLAGTSPEKIADRLNSEGHRAREGGLFLGSVIRTWLENPRYVGNEMLQATYCADPGGKRIPNDGVLPRYWVQGTNPPIISEETWERTQAELARRRASGGRALTPTGGTGALTHRVYCSICGRRFHRRTKTRRHVSYKFWWCETATRGKGNPCHAPQVRETELRRAITCVLDLGEWENDAVLEQVRTITISPNRQAVVTLEDGRVHTITLGEEN